MIQQVTDEKITRQVCIAKLTTHVEIAQHRCNYFPANSRTSPTGRYTPLPISFFADRKVHAGPGRKLTGTYTPVLVIHPAS